MAPRFDFEEFLATNQPGRYIRRLPQLDYGSSRRVYALNDRLVIKMASCVGDNISGLGLRPGKAQNRVEAMVSADPDSKNLVARVFVVGPKYRWIISERCTDGGNYKNLDEGGEKLRALSAKHGLIDDGSEFMVNPAGYLVQVDYGLDVEVRRFYRRAA